jgi:hypothetical protein
MALNDYAAARRSLTECIEIARALSAAEKAGLYEERYLALAAAAMGNLEAALSQRSTNATEAARHREEAGSHYASALAIWSRWVKQNLATVYASREEQIVQRARAALNRIE